MAQYLISVASTSREVATLKVIRKFSTDSLVELKDKLKTASPVLVFDSRDYPRDLLIEAGTVYQQKRIRDACKLLRDAGAEIQLAYMASPTSRVEKITEQMMENLFEAELAYLAQEHD